MSNTLHNIRVTNDTIKAGIRIGNKTYWLKPKQGTATVLDVVNEAGLAIHKLETLPRNEIGDLFDFYQYVGGQSLIDVATAIGDTLGADFESAFEPENYGVILEALQDKSRLGERDCGYNHDDEHPNTITSMAYLLAVLFEGGWCDATLHNFEWLRGVANGIIVANPTSSGYLTGACKGLNLDEADNYPELFKKACALLEFAAEYASVFLWDSQTPEQKAASRALQLENIELLKSGQFTVEGEEAETA